MVNVQEYLDKNYPKEDRQKITVLNLEGKDLESVLDLSDFTNLKKLNCSHNELTDLEISKCEKLTELNCCYNLLDDLNFLKELPNPEKLTFLDLNECGVFLPFEEIEKVLESFNVNLIRRGEKLTFFEKVVSDFSETEQKSQLFANDSSKIRKISNDKISNQKINWQETENPFSKKSNVFSDFTEELTQEWIECEFDKKTAREWLENGLQSTDADFARWLRDEQEVNPQQFLENHDEQNLRKQHQKYSKNEKNWTDLHPNFTSELQLEWKLRGFTKKETEQWIKNFRLEPIDAGLAQVLKSQSVGPEILVFFDHNSKHLKHFPDSKHLKILEPLKIIFRNSLEQKNIKCDQCKKNINDKESAQLKEGLYFCSKNCWDKSRQLGHETEKFVLDRLFKKHTMSDIMEAFEESNLSGKGVEKWTEDIEKGSGGKKIQEFVEEIKEWKREEQERSPKVAQEYLDLAPKWKRSEVKNLKEDDSLKNKNLEGELNLSDLINLEKLDCSHNKLTSLNLSNCGKLKEIDCWDNQLTNLDCSNLNLLEEFGCSFNKLTQVPYFSNPNQLVKLHIASNNLIEQDLTVFSQFRNLKRLLIGNFDENRIKQGFYDHWIGSLEPLRNLNNLEFLYIVNTNISGSLEPLKDFNKLTHLDISGTDINSGIEYLPENLEVINFDTRIRPTCKLAEIKERLDQECWKDIHKDFAPKQKKEWLDQGFGKEQIKEWIEVGAKPNDAEFIVWLINTKKVNPNWVGENKGEFEYLRHKKFVLSLNRVCEECQQPNSSEYVYGFPLAWCQPCNAKHFEEEFSNWTSGNPEIDEVIREFQSKATSGWNVLEWIPYEQFSEIKYLAQGGFGKVYKAEWKDGPIISWQDKEWKRKGWIGNQYVALKTLENSKNMTAKFLRELTFYKNFESEANNIVPCYGISKDKEDNYIMVMEYMRGGNLREYLKKNYKRLNFSSSKSGANGKISLLKQIAQGLESIHREKLIHKDFHSGNILIDEDEKVTNLLNKHEFTNMLRDLTFVANLATMMTRNNSGAMCYITDLGLCRPTNEKDGNKVYGILPYVAPEALQGQPYAQASDVYSFGMVAYEILTGLPPYYDRAHDTQLGVEICQGLRPQFPKSIKFPQLLIELINKCWDSQPDNRPTMKEINKIINSWIEEHEFFRIISLRSNTDFYQQVQEVEKYNEDLFPSERFIDYENYYKKCSGKVYHSSKTISTKQIAQLAKDPTNQEQYLTLEIQKLEKEIGKTFTEEQKELVRKFIGTKKKVIEGKEEEDKTWDLEDQLQKKGFVQEDINKIILYFDRLIKELEKSQSSVDVEALNIKTKRQLSLASQNEPLPQTKSTKLTESIEAMDMEEKPEIYAEPSEMDYTPQIEQPPK